MNRAMILFFATVWMIAIPAGVSGHGTDYRVLNEAPVIVTEFFYSDKEPMRYAEVLIFSPEDDNIEYQNGRTDQNGRFAFYPEIPGSWRIKVNDGVGHAVEATVMAKPKGDAGKQLEGSPRKEPLSFAHASLIVRVLLGLSILLNLILVMYLWKYKKSKIVKEL